MTEDSRYTLNLPIQTHQEVQGIQVEKMHAQARYKSEVPFNCASLALQTSAALIHELFSTCLEKGILSYEYNNLGEIEGSLLIIELVGGFDLLLQQS